MPPQICIKYSDHFSVLFPTCLLYEKPLNLTYCKKEFSLMYDTSEEFSQNNCCVLKYFIYVPIIYKTVYEIIAFWMRIGY